MTNGERADRLIREARQIADEMKRALDHQAWNLGTRRAPAAVFNWIHLTLRCGVR